MATRSGETTALSSDAKNQQQQQQSPSVIPRSFYNPYISSHGGGGGDHHHHRRGAHSLAQSKDKRHRRQSHPSAGAVAVRHTYLTDLNEFKFIAPKCLDVNNEEDEIDGGRTMTGPPPLAPKGTHIGTLKRAPVAYSNGEAWEFLDYEKSAGKLWPVRSYVWGNRWFGPDDFDPRFSRFHIYDMIEGVETASSAEGRDSPRFLQLINPTGTIITMLGMTECGKRVAVHVYGERPYFYMNKAETDAACGSRGPRDLVDRMVACLRDCTVGGGAGGSGGGAGGWKGGYGPTGARYASAECFDVDVVVKTDIYYYGTPSDEFYRVKARSAKHVSAICDNFCPSVTKYEGSVDVVTRMVLDHEGFVSFGWYRLTNGTAGEKVQVRRPEHHTTSCDVEINCTADNLVCEPDDSEWPGYKLACFDIECKAGGDNETAFPAAENEEDVVIQISCLLYSLRERRLDRVMIFSLGSCDLPEACLESLKAETSGGLSPDVFEFDSEFELLLAFMTFVKQYAPEFVTGYNIVNFDWTYLYGKMSEVYGVRLDGYGTVNRGGTFRVWDAGTNRFQKKSKAKINGIVTLDMYAVAADKLRLRSYKLDAVAESVLGERKKDLPYKEIPGRFASGPAGRGSIGEYCIQDSVLVGKLFFKFLPHLELSAVAKLAGILLSRAIYDGQQVRVFTCILRLARTKGFVLPDNRSRFSAGESSSSFSSSWQGKAGGKGGGGAALLPIGGDDDDGIGGGEFEEEVTLGEDGDDPLDEAAVLGSPAARPASKKADGGGGSGRTVGYQGATVLDPVTGFHVDPVVVFDFASLYPSIMQAHNLCFSTLAPSPDRVAGLRPGEDYFEIDVLDKRLFFVRRHVRESMLAVLLDDWLAMRKAIRARMAETEDEDQAVLLDKQQAAIKVVCNSVYGFCGVSNGFLPCVDVAATVTTIGRQMLLKVRDHIHSEWSSIDRLAERFPAISPSVSEGQRYSCSVVYGDTDSVFVKFRGVPAELLVAAGQEMARSVSGALFVSPIKLECEKTFVKLLLITKKKYIGVVHGGKMIMKGVELVRRNNCRFINDYSRRLVDLLFRDEKVASAAAEIGASPAEWWTTHPLPEGMKAFGGVLVEAYERIARPTAELDVKDFVMSAELSRPADAYVNRRIAHLTVYYKLRMRAEQEPAVKERISYVIAEPSEALERDAEMVARLRGDYALHPLSPPLAPFSLPPPSPSGTSVPSQQQQGKKRKLLVSDMAEDPKYVVEKKARLSTDYYFSHLIGSLTVTFKALFGNDTKITELILKRFIPETHFEPSEETAKFAKAGFVTVDLGAGTVSGEEENRRKLRTALRILAAARRLC